MTTVGCPFFQTHVSETLIQQCTACCLKCNSVCSALLSSRENPSVSNYCSRSGVGAGVLYIPCPPPLISDRLFSISSLHQLDPLTDNLLPREGRGLLGCRTKKGGGVLVVSPLFQTLPSKPVLAPIPLSWHLVFMFPSQESQPVTLHLPSLQCFYFERTKECSMQRFI